MPPEFTGTMTVAWSATMSRDEVSYVRTWHTEGSASLQAVSGNTIFDPYLVFATGLTGSITLTTDLGCTSHATLSAAPDTTDGYAYVPWGTPEDNFQHEWSFGEFPLTVLRQFDAPADGCPAHTDGLTGMSPFEPFQDFAVLEIPAFDVPNTDPSGGRFHIIGNTHHDASEAWAQSYNASHTGVGEFHLDAYQVDVTYDLTRISRTSAHAQYPSLRLSNDARGRDVIRVQSRQAVAGVRLRLVKRPRDYGGYINLGGDRHADKHGAFRVVLADPKPSRETCYQVLIEANKLTLPGQSVIRCID